jgi:hypothetical protein
MVASLDAGDRSTMARDMNTVPDFIRDQTLGSFAVFIRDPTPTILSMKFPKEPLARFAHMRADEERIVRDRNREQYARHLPTGDTREAPREESPDPPPSGGGRRRRDPEDQ